MLNNTEEHKVYLQKVMEWLAYENKSTNKKLYISFGELNYRIYYIDKNTGKKLRIAKFTNQKIMKWILNIIN